MCQSPVSSVWKVIELRAYSLFSSYTDYLGEVYVNRGASVTTTRQSLKWTELWICLHGPFKWKKKFRVLCLASWTNSLSNTFLLKASVQRATDAAQSRKMKWRAFLCSQGMNYGSDISFKSSVNVFWESAQWHQVSRHRPRTLQNRHCWAELSRCEGCDSLVDIVRSWWWWWCPLCDIWLFCFKMSGFLVHTDAGKTQYMHLNLNFTTNQVLYAQCCTIITPRKTYHFDSEKWLPWPHIAILPFFFAYAST